MNHYRRRLLLACLSAALIMPGCATPSWPWGKSQDAAAPASTAGSAKSDDLAGLKNPMAMARLCERRGQTEEAERLYLEMIAKSPDNPAPQHRLAVLYAKKGRFKEADEHFNRALALKPNDPELLSDLGYFYHLGSRLPDAERCLRRALEIDPANRTYANNLALVLGELGRREESLAMFRRAATSDQQACANFAFVLAQRGEYKQAMDMYDRVLTEDQTNRVAAEAMIDLSRRLPPRNPSQPAAQPANDRAVVAAYQYPPNQGPPVFVAQGGGPTPYAPQGLAPQAMTPALAANQYPPSPQTFAAQTGAPPANVPQDPVPPAAIGTNNPLPVPPANQYPSSPSTQAIAAQASAAPASSQGSTPSAAIVAASPLPAPPAGSNPAVQSKEAARVDGAASGVLPWSSSWPPTPTASRVDTVASSAGGVQSSSSTESSHLGMVRLSEYLIVTVAIGWVLWGMGTVFTRWRSGLRYLLVLGERLQGMGTGHVLAGESAATRDNAAAGWPMPEPLRLFPDGGAADAVPRRVPRPTTPAA